MEAMRRLVRRGFPLNAWKLQLLVRTLNVLGVLMAGSKYQIGNKAMKKLFGSSLPRNAKELMALMGRLNFAGQFIPDYKRRVRPLLQLMKGAGGRWTEDHMAIVNELARLVG